MHRVHDLASAVNAAEKPAELIVIDVVQYHLPLLQRLHCVDVGNGDLGASGNGCCCRDHRMTRDVLIALCSITTLLGHRVNGETSAARFSILALLYAPGRLLLLKHTDNAPI